MKLAILLTLALTFATASADTWVNGYTRKDGTLVQGHYRSDPNGTKADNWSTKGNTNPYTGKQGTKSLDYDWSRTNSADDSDSGGD